MTMANSLRLLVPLDDDMPPFADVGRCGGSVSCRTSAPEPSLYQYRAVNTGTPAAHYGSSVSKFALFQSVSAKG